MQRKEDQTLAISAHVAPYLLYVIPTMIESMKWEFVSYQLICTLKGVLAAAAFLGFRRHYPVFTAAGFKLAVLAGILGCGLWIGLDQLQAILPVIQSFAAMLGLTRRAGFNPFENGTPSAGAIAFVVVRLLELTIVVPLIEEVFWRGFLARYLIQDDFRNVPQGKFTAFSFTIVTLAFASTHPEILAAIAWGMLINLLYHATANIWACIVMHGVTNGLLALYVLTTQNWHLW